MLTLTLDVDRRAMFAMVEENPVLLKQTIKDRFKIPLNYLLDAAAVYYKSVPALSPLLLRTFLIAVIDEEAIVKEYFGSNYAVIKQHVYDIAFLRQLMLLVKKSRQIISIEDKALIIKTSNIASFREKIKEQRYWSTLLKKMDII